MSMQYKFSKPHISQPYRRMDSMVAMKNLSFRSLRMSDFQTELILFKACHASALRMRKSFSDFIMWEPRYLKSGTLQEISSEVPAEVFASFL